MKKKLLTVLLAATASLCLCFSLAACGDGNKPNDNPPDKKHTHNYIWVDNKDGTHKQHCQNSGCDAPDINAGNHDFTNGDCVCGKEKPFIHTHTYDRQVANETYLKTVASCTQSAIYYYSCECGAKGMTTFELGKSKGHKFTAEIVSDEYIKNEANCTHNAVYYKSCSICGEKSTLTFTYGEPVGHSYGNDGICIKCSAHIPSSGLTYRINYITNSALITGIGTCTDKDIYIADTYQGKPVTSIYTSAFSHCSGLTSVTIPDSVTDIGEVAFSGCDSLTSVTIPDSVTTIGQSAFSGCDSLTSVTIPDSVTTIGQSAFSGCDSLTSVTIPDSVTTIGNEAFRSCHSLTSVTIGNSVTTIGNSAFDGCNSLTSVTIGDSITTIGDYAFHGCSITNIKIPDSVTNIGNYAFSVNNITNLSIPNNVTNIGNYAFSANNITNLSIPDNVTNIGNYAFAYCSNLTSVTIGNSVTAIGEYAFKDCHYLTRITIPKSVTSIGNYVFDNCRALTIYCEAINKLENWQNSWNNNYPVVWNCNNNEIAEDGCIYTTIDKIKYSLKGDVAQIATQPTNISGEIKIPKNVTYKNNIYNVIQINSSVFSGCNDITSITISDSVTSIGDSAFSDCSNLTSITISDSVTSIGDSAFSGCDSLTIYCEAESKPNDWASSWNASCPVVWNCKNNEVADDGYIYTVIDRIRYSLKDGIATVVYQPSNITVANIPESVTYKYNTYNVTSIGNSAFNGCSGLTSITIPDSVTSIGNSAFNGCSSLTSITIPDSVMSIGYQAFRDCSSLTNITIPDSVTTIGGFAFDGCSSLTNITIPDSVTSIGSNAFDGCTGLISVTIGNSVTTIGGFAFYYCKNLTRITFNGTIEQWNAISKGSRWNSNTGDYTIHCTDGDIAKS